MMPSIVARKDPKWTGKIVWVGEYNKEGMLHGPVCYVRIDGVIGLRLTGRVLDEQNRPTRVRYYFERLGVPGLPDWCRVVRLCKKCEHFACPFCLTTCDGDIDEDGDMCCDGECTYDEPEFYELYGDGDEDDESQVSDGNSRTGNEDDEKKVRS